MFRIKRPNLRYIEGDEGGAVSSGAESAETNALGGAPVQEETTSHPWDQHVEAFPEGVRGIARERFGQMEKDFNSRFQTLQQQYSPYKFAVDQQIPAERLQAAYNFATQFEADPQQFVTFLAEQLGISTQQAQQVVEEATEEGNPEGEEDPQIAALREQQEQMMQFLATQQEQQQQQQIQAEQEQNISNEIAQIEQQFGKMPPQVLNEVLNRAYMMSVQTDKPVSLMDAYKDLNNFVSQLGSVPRPGASAPRVIAGGNAIPATPQGKSLGELTDRETRDHAAAVLARVLGQGQ